VGKSSVNGPFSIAMSNNQKVQEKPLGMQQMGRKSWPQWI